MALLFEVSCRAETPVPSLLRDFRNLRWRVQKVESGTPESTSLCLQRDHSICDTAPTLVVSPSSAGPLRAPGSDKQPLPLLPGLSPVAASSALVLLFSE